jgi:polyphenol oxidase
VDFLFSSILDDLPWLEHGFGTRHATGFPDRLATLRQVHSALPLVAGEPGLIGEGDALITTQRGLAVSIRTADCLPILLADDRTHVVAAIHAGWRGTAAQIVRKTIEEMSVKFGTDPSSLRAAIGPGIGACCYQVGDEVARQFGLSGPVLLDLATENRKQLVAAGLANSRIDLLGECTFCDAARFHSYRRDGDQAGRMVSYIVIR